MKRGFTLFEMFLAMTLSVVVLTPIVGLLSSVWLMSKEASDEIDCALQARAVREHLFYDLLDDEGKSLGYGLTAATNIVFSAPSGLTAYPSVSGKTMWSVDFNRQKDQSHYHFDKSKDDEGDYRNGEALQYVYLKYENGTEARRGYVAYHDRLVVPVFGRGQSLGRERRGETRDKFVEAFGGRNWDP